MASQQPNKTPVVEILEKTDKYTGGFDVGMSWVKAIPANEAFRKYDYLRGIPGLNDFGNLRGMVVSENWRTVFTYASDVGELLGDIALVAGIAVNLAHAAPDIKRIATSNDPWLMKAEKLRAQVNSVALRTVAGVIPATFSLLALSMQGYCQLGGVVSGGRFQPKSCIDNLDAATRSVNTTFDKLTSGDTIYTLINMEIVPLGF